MFMEVLMKAPNRLDFTPEEIENLVHRLGVSRQLKWQVNDN
jgi:hypothetical protein